MSINDAWDNGTGFTPLACELEERFGVLFRFGNAGGCANMMARFEGGLTVNVTDADEPFLTHIDRRTAEDGFTVGLYSQDGWENGEALIYLTRYLNADRLGDMITEALDLLKEKV